MSIPEDIKAKAAEVARMIDRRYDPPDQWVRLGHLVSDEEFTAHLIALALLAEREKAHRSVEPLRD